MADSTIEANQLANMRPEFARAYQATIQAERKPIENLEQRKEKIQEKVSLLNDLVTKVDGLKQLLPGLGTPFAMREVAFASDDPRTVTGSADKSIAEPGKHNIEVLQLASGPSALTNRFPDPNETRIGSGYMTFTTQDGETKEVFIDYDNSTLEGIARSINEASLGIKAIVTNDVSDPENSYRIILSSPQEGAKNDVNYPEFYFTGGEEDFFIEEKKDAENAVIRYRGIQIQSSNNEVNDLIPGVTISIKGLTESGKPTTVSIEQDIPQTTIKMKDLVDKTNSILGFIQEQNTMDEKTDTSRTLGGNYSLRVTEDRIRSALRENFLGQKGRGVQSLADVGIQSTRNGTLQFDEKKFAAALEKDFDSVVDLVSGDGVTYGVIPKLNRALTSLTESSTGLLSSQRKNFVGQIDGIDRNISRTEKSVEIKAQNLKNTLSRAQAAIQAMQSQGSAIAGGANQMLPSG